MISYDSPYGLQVNYHAQAQWLTLDGAYNNWVATREPPLFGTEPDARVWALCGSGPGSRHLPVLDIGGGTGRNALPLARRGHPVDVVEMTDKFAEIIRLEAARESLNIRVIQRDVFASRPEDLRRDYQMILLSEVVSDFRGVEQLRSLFELASQCLAPGGLFGLQRVPAPYQVHPRRRRPRTGPTVLHDDLHLSGGGSKPRRCCRWTWSPTSRSTTLKANLPPVATHQLVRRLGQRPGRLRHAPGSESIEMRWLVYRKGGWIVQRRSSEDSPARW